MFDQALDIRAFRIGDELSIELDNGDVFDGIVSGRNIHRPEQAQNWVKITVKCDWDHAKKYVDHEKLTLSQLMDNGVITSITLSGKVDAEYPDEEKPMKYDLISGVTDVHRLNTRHPIEELMYLGYRFTETYIQK